MATKMVLQSTAIRDAGASAPTQRRGPPTKRDHSLAKRLNGPAPDHLSPNPRRPAVAASKRPDRPQDSGVAPVSMPMSLPTSVNDMPESTAVVVPALRPKQVLAATLLVQGQQGRQVAKALNVNEETVSRWRHRPEFQALMRELLQEHIDTVRLGLISLSGEAIAQLHHLINAFSDQTALKACSLVLNRVGPLLGVIGGELRRPPEMERR